MAPELSSPCEGGKHGRCDGSVFPLSYPSEVPCSCECHAAARAWTRDPSIPVPARLQGDEDTGAAMVAAAEESGQPPRDWREDT